MKTEQELLELQKFILKGFAEAFKEVEPCAAWGIWFDENSMECPACAGKYPDYAGKCKAFYLEYMTGQDIVKIEGGVQEEKAVAEETVEKASVLGEEAVESLVGKVEVVPVEGKDEWKEGTSAQTIFLAAKYGKEEGVTAEEVLEAVKDKFVSTNPIARIKKILTEAVARGLLVKNGKLYQAKR